MASFNLGRVKGDKGDKGDTGAKGERGEKGEKGDTGARGIDGRTPVFAVGETVTISPEEEAHVELNSDDAENPVLSFYIPRGHDGRDAMGDMLSAVLAGVLLRRRDKRTNLRVLPHIPRFRLSRIAPRFFGVFANPRVLRKRRLFFNPRNPQIPLKRPFFFSARRPFFRVLRRSLRVFSFFVF